jgi:hypothetical protein
VGRGVVVVIALVLLLLGTGASTAAAGPATTTTELRAYLASVGRLSSPYIKWKGGAWRVVELTPISVELGDEETLALTVRGIRRAERELTTITGRMRRISAPRDLRSLHAGFWRSVNAEAQCTGRVADVAELGGNVRSATNACKETFVGTTARQRHWRSEITALARRLGVVVPFWVKRIGIHPK